MKLQWTKSGNGDWICEYGVLRAIVSKPTGPLGFAHWCVYADRNKTGRSGGTSSVQESKKSAENEIRRFDKFLRT